MAQGHVKGIRTIKLIYKPLVWLASRSALTGRNRSRCKPEKGRFTSADVNRLLGRAWRGFDDLAPAVPVQPTVGSRMNVLPAALMVSMLNALLAAESSKTTRSTCVQTPHGKSMPNGPQFQGYWRGVQAVMRSSG